MRPYLVSLRRQTPQTPWGFRIAGGTGTHDPPYIFQVVPGSLAEKKGLKERDEILQVGQTNVTSMTCGQVHDLVVQQGDHVDIMVLRPSTPKPENPEKATKKILFHNPYNSPMGLYSEDNVNETLAMQAKVMGMDPKEAIIPKRDDVINGRASPGGQPWRRPQAQPAGDTRQPAPGNREGGGSSPVQYNQLKERYIPCSYIPENPLPPASPPPLEGPPPLPPKDHPLTTKNRELQTIDHQQLYFKVKPPPKSMPQQAQAPYNVAGCGVPPYTGPAMWPPPSSTHPSRQPVSPVTSPLNVRRLIQKMWPPRESAFRDFPKSGFLQSCIGHPEGQKLVWPPPKAYEHCWTPPPAWGGGGARNAWHPSSPSPGSTQRLPSPSPRRKDIAWPPPSPQRSNSSAPPSPSPSRRGRRPDNFYINQQSGMNLPPTYRPPPFVPVPQESDY